MRASGGGLVPDRRTVWSSSIRPRGLGVAADCSIAGGSGSPALQELAQGPRGADRTLQWPRCIP